MNNIYHGHNKLIVYSGLVLTLFLVICLFSCAPQQPVSPPPNPDSLNQPVSPVPQTTPSSPSNGIDGIKADNEYSNTSTYDNGNYEISWVSDGTYISILVKAKTTGFVAVGIQPDITMQHADIIIGDVKDGKTTVLDSYSVDAFGPHMEDTTLGGTDDVKQYAGVEQDGYTSIEFRRKLDTGDQYDNPLSAGKNKIIWSYGAEDDFVKKHASRGYGEIGL